MAQGCRLCAGIHIVACMGGFSISERYTWCLLSGLKEHLVEVPLVLRKVPIPAHCDTSHAEVRTLSSHMEAGFVFLSGGFVPIFTSRYLCRSLRGGI